MYKLVFINKQTIIPIAITVNVTLGYSIKSMIR